MDPGKFMDILNSIGDEFFTGVPDSLLGPFIDCIVGKYGVSDKHIVAANEGLAVGLAAGHYLATRKPAVVYMQNSGIGNAVNPICSLLHDKVYAIPVIFVIGWRGEPGVKDEPQHVFQGEVTLSLLECLQIPYTIVSKDSDLQHDAEVFCRHLERGQSVAFVVRKDAFINAEKVRYSSEALISRESALESILDASTKNDYFVCTTGKLSREMYELRKNASAGHNRDFLTVGSMGHSLAIAHGISRAKPQNRIWCLDGDGAMLMHMGSLAVVGVHKPKNLVHVVINNGAHETVGGLPAASKYLRLCDVAKAVGYDTTFHVACGQELADTLAKVQNKEGLIFVEIMCNLDSRPNLGRPATTPRDNKEALMAQLAK